MTPQFHRLEIAEIRRETDEAVSIAFAVPEKLREAFRFLPGQHLTVKAVIEGEEIRRCYSICSGLDDGELRIAVKRVAGGIFSAFANEVLAAGHKLEIMTPSGHFTAPLDPSAERCYLGLAAGSGITPLLSLIRTILAREPKSRFFLLYGNRTSRSILFKEALEDLKDRFLDRLSVTHVLSREAQDVPALSGRLDGEKIALLLGMTVPVGMIDHAFVCGPPGLPEEAERVLTRLGLAADRIHIERFTLPEEARKRVPARPAISPAATRAAIAEAEAVLDGIRYRFAVAKDESIIDAAERAGLDLPFSCRGGMCCTCRAKIVEGSVEMAVNYSLEAWELKAGFALTCQARPTTPRIVVDYDQV